MRLRARYLPPSSFLFARGGAADFHGGGDATGSAGQTFTVDVPPIRALLVAAQ